MACLLLAVGIWAIGALASMHAVQPIASEDVHYPLIRWSLPSVFSGAGGLERVNAEVTRQGAMIGYDAAFGGLCIFIVAMLPLLLIMRPVETKPASSSRRTRNNSLP